MKAKQILLGQILLVHAFTGAMAASVTWSPSAGVGTSGLWSTTSNWSTGALPGSTDTVVLPDPGATTRTITLDSSLTKTVGGITFTAPTSGTSILDIQGYLTNSTGLGIGANSMIYLEANASSTQSPVYKGNLWVNGGGTLEMEATAAKQAYVNGVVYLNPSGTINLEMGTGTTGASAYNLGVWGFNMSGGTLNAGVTPRNGAAGDSTDNRIIVASSANTFNVTGGTVNVSGTTWSLYLQSPSGTGTNYYNPTTQTGAFSQFVFFPSTAGTQTLVTNQVLPTLYLRTAGLNLVLKNTNTSASGNIGSIQLANTGANLTTTLTLASNLTSTPGSGLPTAWGTVASGTVGLAIDTGAGYTLDITKCGSGAATFQPTSSGTGIWSFQGSGKIKAYAFDLSKPAYSNVLNSITLEATGNSANNLGGNGTVSGSSTFLYAGNATAGTPATITSNRHIGNLKVLNGALRIAGEALNMDGLVTVDNGGTLDLSNYGITAGGGLVLGSSTASGLIAGNNTVMLAANNGDATTATIVSGTIASSISSGTAQSTLTKTGATTTVVLAGINSYLGTTTVSQGKLDVNGSLAAESAVFVNAGATLGGSGTANGTVTVNSGAINGNGLRLGATTLYGASSVSGTSTATSITVSSGTTTASGVTNASSSLAVNATAMLQNTGTTTANTVTVENTATLTNNGLINADVNVSGLLNGTGTINGALTIKNAGELAPGNSPGITTVSGSLTVETGAKVSMQIAGTTTAGTDYDQIVVTGASSRVTLNAGSILDLTLDVALAADQSITLIENQSDTTITGNFSAVVIGSGTYDLTGSNAFTYNGQKYQLAYNVNSDNGSVANDLELQAVPEPSTWAAMVGGLAMLAFWRGRKGGTV